MLGGFHHWVVRRLTGTHPKRSLDVTWEYPPLVEVVVEVGIQESETFVDL